MRGIGLVEAMRGLMFLLITGGGRMPPFRPIEAVLEGLESEEAYEAIGGLFTVWVRAGAAGRSEGTGGGGLLPKV